MTTILAESFTASLTKLTNEEKKQARLTAFDMQTDLDRPGLQMHRIEASKDPNFWSVRVNRDLRVIIHKTGGNPRCWRKRCLKFHASSTPSTRPVR